ncbi:MAG: formimidoylglutamate deiminase, partial [Longimicrobiales bacterium]|nr:formimidoylglutamate deiminase [Longimicrobiales bacterium]
MTRYLAPLALLPDGWTRDVILEPGPDGLLSRVAVAPSPDADLDAGVGAGEAPAQRLPGPVVPGIVNAHSHAFQRALAGGAEVRSGPEGGDSFWSWREAMYRFLAVLDPDQVEAVAARVYVEMLRHGYTRVVEFHYLHNDPRGRPYADPAEVARRLVRAAESAGIGLTLLPVLYRHGGFGGASPEPAQRRFILEVDRFLELLEVVRRWTAEGCEPGFAFHSLRAVTPDEMVRVLEAPVTDALPRHIHVAEQEREVAACRTWSGSRPVAWLLDHAPVDGRWSLVHCTHMTPEEGARLARSGAVAVVCPATEGNLGDGFFSLAGHLQEGGRLAVGSDSHVSVSPVEELRWLEYGQRLRSRTRIVAAGAHASVARTLLEAVWEGGAGAAGGPAAGLAEGRRADWVVLDGEHPALAGRSG